MDVSEQIKELEGRAGQVSPATWRPRCPRDSGAPNGNTVPHVPACHGKTSISTLRYRPGLPALSAWYLFQQPGLSKL